MDILMFIIAVAFTLEMLGLLMVDELYRYSFFFAMDLLGTLSMAFEISFLLGQLVNSNTVVLRTARTAKLGARIGRLIKLVKCVSMFYRSSGKKSSQVEAKVLASNWALTSTNQTTNALEQSIDQMVQRLGAHRSDFGELPGSKGDWAKLAETEDLKQGPFHPFHRSQYGSMIRYGFQDWSKILCTSNLAVPLDEVCNAAVLFDFTSPAQLDALVEVVTIAFIIGLMALTSCDLQQVVDANLVKPLEGMLQHVRENAAHIFERFSKQTQAADLDSEENEDTGASEIELIQLILKKLARLATLAEVSTHAVTQNELENMNAERKAVLLDMLNVQVLPAPMLGFPSAKRPTQLDFEVSWTQSWDLNFLDTSPEEMHKYVHYMFFSSQFGVAYHYVTEEIFSQFVHNVEGNYKDCDVPYHRFHHGVDVLFTVFRLLQLSHAGKWTGEIEQYALLVASLCHDLGHFGKTNQFLVEIKHELALRYNDKSPLENMHCAMLFQLCQHAGQDVFADATEEQQKEARKIAISVILHTDNVHHFDMVKDVSAVYEMDSEICDAQAAAPEVITQAYREKVLLGKNKMMWLQLFLHFADVSNPLKPFEICKAWAWRVLDEFFAQGDEEKSLGIPVGMLNDREKVNRPGSQHGFINFLVAPFVAASVVRVFPGLQPMHAQMVSNLEAHENARRVRETLRHSPRCKAFDQMA
ncbi:5'-cyclic phosphodiesterase pde-4 [Durusdinium trenchii]|uniref:Phosphodiesterase n=1 Tax=Durusdinium trenchii TaxID=1381693 RepID=A0ABP0MP52_9DINO